MLRWIQARPKWLRIIIFFALLLGVIALIFGATLAVAWYGINGTPRIKSVALGDDVTVRQFAQLPGDDAYPAALALASDGTLYVGGYTTGAIWQVTPDGEVLELPDTRTTIGAVTGVTLLPDGTLMALDRIDPLELGGARLWHIEADGALSQWSEIPLVDNLIPYDLTSDADGNLYVSLIYANRPDEVLRFTPDGQSAVWWTTPDEMTVTGLTYDASREAIIAVDTRQNALYALPVTTDEPEAALLYRYTAEQSLPGFDGLDVAPDGTFYIAAIGLNRVARLNVDTGELTYLAGAFRGSSRVVYDAARQRVYVNNWDQRSLLPEQLLFVEIDVLPRLPFLIDVVELKN